MGAQEILVPTVHTTIFSHVVAMAKGGKGFRGGKGSVKGIGKMLKMVQDFVGFRGGKGGKGKGRRGGWVKGKIENRLLIGGLPDIEDREKRIEASQKLQEILTKKAGAECKWLKRWQGACCCHIRIGRRGAG